VSDLVCLRHYGELRPKALAAALGKIRRKAAYGPVWIDLEGVSRLHRKAAVELAETCREIGENRVRIIGISSALWAEYIDLWQSLGPIAIPPVSTWEK